MSKLYFTIHLGVRKQTKNNNNWPEESLDLLNIAADPSNIKKNQPGQKKRQGFLIRQKIS